MSFHRFGVDMTGTERVSGVQSGAAYDFVKDHRNQIAAMAREYKLDALVLANVLYQERRHAGIDDFAQDRDPARHPNATLGPGQMNVSMFKELVEKGAVHLSAQERSQYQNDKDGFSRRFLVEPKSGIEATAALISDRLQTLQDHKLIPPLKNDGNPNTLSVGQFLYGAALYSAGGRVDGGGRSEFDRKGPTSEQIDFKANSLWGMVGRVPQDEKIITAFHYLPDTYEAFYGKTAPDRLGGYFHDRSVIRGTSRASADGPEEAGVQMAAQPTAPRGETRVVDAAGAATAFGDSGQPGHAMFVAIAPQIARLDTGLDAQQSLNLSGALTARALENGLDPRQVNVTVNDRGRVFAHEGGEAGRIAFVDRDATAQPLQASAERTREILAAQAPTPEAPAVSTGAMRMG